MNYFEKLEEKKNAILDYSAFCEAYTYEVYEEFIKKSIPLIIEQSLAGDIDKHTDKISFVLSFYGNKKEYTINKELAYLSHSQFDLEYGRVDKKLFMDLIESMKGFSMRENVCHNINYLQIRFTFDLEQLIEFYYEELQRMEYQTGKSR